MINTCFEDSVKAEVLTNGVANSLVGAATAGSTGSAGCVGWLEGADPLTGVGSEDGNRG